MRAAENRPKPEFEIVDYENELSFSMGWRFDLAGPIIPNRYGALMMQEKLVYENAPIELWWLWITWRRGCSQTSYSRHSHGNSNTLVTAR